VFASSVDMGEEVLVALGRHPFEAHRAARAFKGHDEELVQLSAQHVGDTEKLIDIARQGRAEIANVLSSDRSEDPQAVDGAWEAPDGTRE
jgi:hypothetical protein